MLELLVGDSVCFVERRVEERRLFLPVLAVAPPLQVLMCVVSLELDTLLLGVGEGVGNPASLAPFVFSFAVHDLLH